MLKSDKILAVTIGLIISILLGEIVLRVYNYCHFYDPTLKISKSPLLYEHRPSIKFTNRYGLEVKYNSLGFIGDEVGPKSRKSLRILGIGDSITEAPYLPVAENYLNRTAEILSERTGRKLEVINAAVTGYNTWQELELLKTKGLDVEPDLIIVGICLNDFVHTAPRLSRGLLGGVLENYTDGSKARYFNFLYQHSNLYKFLYDSASKMRLGMYSNEHYKQYVSDYNFTIHNTDFEKWIEPLSGLMLVAKEHKIKIVFVIFPLENQVVKKMNDSYASLSEFFRINNAYYVDLMGCFVKGYLKQIPMFQERDLIHPTSIGHEIAAQELAGYIVRGKILE